MELGAAVAASTEVKRRKSGALAGLVAGVFSHPRAQKTLLPQPAPTLHHNLPKLTRLAAQGDYISW
jgi:hypothetical protein